MESFVCYVDEAGDEGFKFSYGSSKWFILSGIVFRKENDTEETMKILGFMEKINWTKKNPLHWKKLRHEKKVAYAIFIRSLKARIISICVDKTKLIDIEKFQDKYCLYFYCTRLLIERISWLCKNSYVQNNNIGNGKCRIVFSNRAAMPYNDMRDYLYVLKMDTSSDVRINWDYIDNNIQVYSPGLRYGLQLADGCAGSFFHAFEKNPYGNIESRYLREVSPIIYRYKKNIVGYGIKLFPREAIEDGLKEINWIYNI